MSEKELEQSLLREFERILYDSLKAPQRIASIPTPDSEGERSNDPNLPGLAGAAEMHAPRLDRFEGAVSMEEFITRRTSLDEPRIVSHGDARTALPQTTFVPSFTSMGVRAANTSTEAERPSEGRSTLRTVVNTAFGAVPLVRLFSNLIGGGKPKEPPPLIRSQLPPAIRIEAANGRTSEEGRLWLREVRYGQGGRAEAIDQSVPANSSGLQQDVTSRGVTQVHVNVQAMDSRSFVDHSGDIARAVRDAMLNMHSLNDVISEL